MYTLSAKGSLKLHTCGTLETHPPRQATYLVSRCQRDRRRYTAAAAAAHHVVSFEPVHGFPEELGAAVLPLGDAVALPQEVVVDLVGDDAVLPVLGVLGHKLPHPLGHGHEFPCGRTETKPCGWRPSVSWLHTSLIETDSCESKQWRKCASVCVRVYRRLVS